MWRNKNKYQSQQIAKKFKNKHRNVNISKAQKSSVLRQSKKHLIKLSKKCQIKNCQYGSKKELKRLKKKHFKNCDLDCKINTHINSKSPPQKYGYTKSPPTKYETFSTKRKIHACIVRPYDNYDIFNVLRERSVACHTFTNDNWYIPYYITDQVEQIAENGMIFDDFYNFEEKYHWKCKYKQKNKYMSQQISKKFKNKHKKHKKHKCKRHTSTKTTKYQRKWCKQCQKKYCKFGKSNNYSKQCDNTIIRSYYDYQDLYDTFDDIDKLNQIDIDEQYIQLFDENKDTQLIDIDEQYTEIKCDENILIQINTNMDQLKESKELQNTYAQIATKTCSKQTPKIILSTDIPNEPTFNDSHSVENPNIEIDYYTPHLYSDNKHNYFYTLNISKNKWIQNIQTKSDINTNLFEHKSVQTTVLLTGYIHLNKKTRNGGYIILDDTPENRVYYCQHRILFDKKDCSLCFDKLIRNPRNERVLFDMVYDSFSGFISGPSNIRLPEMKTFMSDNDINVLIGGYLSIYMSYYDIFLPKDIGNIIVWFYSKYEKNEISVDIQCCTQYYINRFIINCKNDARHNTMISKVGLKTDANINKTYSFMFRIIKKPSTGYFAFGILSHPENINIYLGRNENKLERHERWWFPSWDGNSYVNGSNYLSFGRNSKYLCNGDMFEIKIQLNGSNCSLKLYQNNVFEELRQVAVFDDSIYFPFIVFGHDDDTDTESVEFEFWRINT